MALRYSPALLLVFPALLLALTLLFSLTSVLMVTLALRPETLARLPVEVSTVLFFLATLTPGSRRVWAVQVASSAAQNSSKLPPQAGSTFQLFVFDPLFCLCCGAAAAKDERRQRWRQARWALASSMGFQNLSKRCSQE